MRNSKADGATGKKARILLVDDHPIVRERLIDVISREPDLVVCAEAEDRMSGLAAVEKTRPDLVIVDLTLKNSNGLDLIKDIHSRWPRMLMLVVSMHDETLYAERVIRAGARGFITKQEASRRIMQAIRTVLANELYLNEAAAKQIIKRMAGPEEGQADNPAACLADRELQVFELTGKGKNVRQIATELRIGVKTVETYRARIREKLNLETGSDLLQAAISWLHR